MSLTPILLYCSRDWGRSRCVTCGISSFMCLGCLNTASKHLQIVEDEVGRLDREKHLLLTGEESGACSLVALEARRRGIQVRVLKADLNYYGAKAQTVRNHLFLALYPERVTLFTTNLPANPDCEHLARICLNAGLKVEVVGQEHQAPVITRHQHPRRALSNEPIYTLPEAMLATRLLLGPAPPDVVKRLESET